MADAAVVMGVLALVLFVAVLVSYVIYSFLLGRVFKKAGVPQWAAWVPIYNIWQLLIIGNQKGFWALLSLVPFLNIVSTVFLYIAMYHVSKKLGKDDWFVILAIFLPIIWLLWLAFDNSKWPTTKKHATKNK